MKQAPTKLGQYWPEQGGLYCGITLGDDGKQYHQIVARREDYEPIQGVWGTYGESVGNCDSERDGHTNTLAMAAAGSQAAQEVIALRIGGLDDWHIAARAQAAIAYWHARAALPDAWIWTSTQGSANYAWYQYRNGGQYWGYKYDEGAVVPVRRLLVEE